MSPNTRQKVLYDESKKVSDWYENLAAKSDLTADYYLRNLGLWLEWTQEDPESIIALAKNNYPLFRKKYRVKSG